MKNFTKEEYEEDSRKLMAERDRYRNLCELKDERIEDCYKHINYYKDLSVKREIESSEKDKEIERLKSVMKRVLSATAISMIESEMDKSKTA